MMSCACLLEAHFRKKLKQKKLRNEINQINDAELNDYLHECIYITKLL